MKWETGGWAAILCGLLALSSASAQALRLPGAKLGLPAETDARQGGAAKTEPSSPMLPAAPSVQVELLVPPSRGDIPVATQDDAGEKGSDKNDPDDKDDTDDKDQFRALKGLPDANELFGLSSEAQLFQRIQVERKKDEPAFQLPPMPEYRPAAAPTPRPWSTLTVLAEPNYLCYRRLLFEQRAFERYGWDLGPIQPPIAAALFYADLMLLPLYWAADPCRDFECNTGLCLPGDPTPLMWHRRIK